MKRTLLALHGLLGTPALFDVLGSKLRDHRLLALSLPGHGRPASTVPPTFEEAADVLAAQLGTQDPVDLVGYSLGGRLALALLARHPGLVRRAVIVSAHPGLAGEDRAQRIAEDEAHAKLVEQHGLEAFVDEWERKPLFASQARVAPHLLANQRKARLSHEPAGIAASLRLHGLGRMPSYATTIAEQAPRIALLVGALDERFLGLAQRLRAATPALAVETIPAAGHNPFLEEPLVTAARIETLLGEDQPPIPRPVVGDGPSIRWQALRPPKENT
ncbi:MAG: alpha/beta fold hydrolase [Polyangia bacterium]